MPNLAFAKVLGSKSTNMAIIHKSCLIVTLIPRKPGLPTFSKPSNFPGTV